MSGRPASLHRRTPPPPHMQPRTTPYTHTPRKSREPPCAAAGLEKREPGERGG
ncbi:hypothetical protein HanXRQr2_Chr16g0764651 [Helianthus annuus]|uniref:Uncharacterized protein n=1 Tax=Helianthus annuus TaxID=4232 RepID=A0A9K3GZY9_HELAN|nr:hypothetical protein HanXRQr2_Chr16g0764651 [Helianthus annuus]